MLAANLISNIGCPQVSYRFDRSRDFVPGRWVITQT